MNKDFGGLKSRQDTLFIKAHLLIQTEWEYCYTKHAHMQHSPHLKPAAQKPVAVRVPISQNLVQLQLGNHCGG